MTETRSVDSDRVDTGARIWPRALAALIVGLLIGALAGGLYGATRPTSYQASTNLSVLPDPTVDITSQTNDQSSVPTLDATAYIQSQLVVINGAQLAERVRSQLGLDARPNVDATQVGQTYVVDIVSSASTQSEATAIARGIGNQYRTLRTRQLTTEINGLLRSTKQQLNTVQGNLTPQRGGANSSNNLTPSQTALQTEYERLLSVRSSLNGTLSQVSKVVTVVSPARVEQSSVSTITKDVLAGAVIGAIVGLIVFFGLRRSIRRVRSVSDLAALDVPVLLPAQPRRTMRSVQRGTFWRAGPGRVLAARLHAEAAPSQRALVFVGSKSRVGTSTVATTVAAALADAGPVLLVQADREAVRAGVPAAVRAPGAHPYPSGSSLVHRSRVTVQSSMSGVWLMSVPASGGTSATRELTGLIDAATESGWLVVVDAAPISFSDVAARCAQAGNRVVMVVGRTQSTPADVLAASELFEAHGTGFLGAVLNDTPGWLRRVLVRWWPSWSPSIRPVHTAGAPLATVGAPPSDRAAEPAPMHAAGVAQPAAQGAPVAPAVLEVRTPEPEPLAPQHETPAAPEPAAPVETLPVPETMAPHDAATADDSSDWFTYLPAAADEVSGTSSGNGRSDDDYSDNDADHDDNESYWGLDTLTTSSYSDDDTDSDEDSDETDGTDEEASRERSGGAHAYVGSSGETGSVGRFASRWRR